MNRYFSTHMPFWRFAWHTLAISLAGMVPLLLVYVFSTPGFAALLLSNGAALARFLRQVITNGLPVVFLVNYTGFFVHAALTDRYGAGRVPLAVVLADLPLRTGLFLGLHLVIYVLSADWFGSFGGDRMQALRAVGPTLARSAYFENLSGVYFYAVVIAAWPLHVPAIERALAGRRRPASSRGAAVWRVLIAGAVSAALALLLTGLAAGIVLMQTR